MKMADITPMHKKDDKTDKSNYRPVKILSTISKIFERIIVTNSRLTYVGFVKVTLHNTLCL